MSWTELDFKPRSASYAVSQEQGGPVAYIQMQLAYSGGSPLVNADGELLEYDYWGVLISPAKIDEDEEYFGKAKRIARNLISVNVELSATRFDALVLALLSGRHIDMVTFQVEGLDEMDSGLVWDNPDNRQLLIQSVTVTFGLLA